MQPKVIERGENWHNLWAAIVLPARRHAARSESAGLSAHLFVKLIIQQIALLSTYLVR